MERGRGLKPSPSNSSSPCDDVAENFHGTDVPEHDTMTFASLIARPTKGEMWVAVGPPNASSYERYAFSRVAAEA